MNPVVEADHVHVEEPAVHCCSKRAQNAGYGCGPPLFPALVERVDTGPVASFPYSEVQLNPIADHVRRVGRRAGQPPQTAELA